MTNIPKKYVDDTNAIEEQNSFILTKEYRRFAEFCDACRREKYIGLCYGAPGVGKTLSARYYAKWFFLENRLPTHLPYLPLPPEIKECHTLLYTAEMSNPARAIKQKISQMRTQLGRFHEELLPPEEQTRIVIDDRISRFCELIIVDESERLKMSGIEQLREIYDAGNIGLIFIGMPGLEKKLSRYPQLYSRVGFAHQYRALSQEEMRFMLSHYWERLDLKMNPNDFTDAEAIAAIARITNGNFRLLNRLFRQIQRVIKINELNCITAEVVEAARECLVIGAI